MKLSRNIKITLLIFFAILLFYHTRGINFQEEGYILNSARQLLDGKIIYKDFFFEYTPGSVFLTSLSFLFFGESVLASRILMIANSLLASFLIFKILNDITGRKEYGYISCILYLAWGPSHINFVHPVMLALTASFLSILLSFRSIVFTKYYLPFFSGLSVFVAFLFKQHFAVILLPILLSQLYGKKNNVTKLLRVIYGFLWGLILFLAYLALTNSLQGFISNLSIYPVRNNLFQNYFYTPLFYFYPSILKTFARNVLYYFPIFISISAIMILIYRKRYHLTFVPIIIALIWFVNKSANSEYINLVLLLSVSGISLSIFMNQYPLKWIKLLEYIGFLVLVILGFYSSLFYGYFRENETLLENSYFVGNRINVFTSSQNENQIVKIVKVVNDNSTLKDSIYINANAHLIYFYLNRNNSSPFYSFEFLDMNSHQKIIRALFINKTKIVILSSSDKNTDLYNFVIKNYKLMDNVNKYEIYKLIVP